MKEWKTYKVGDICSSISETYKSKSKSVVLINTSDVLEGRCLNHEFVPNKDLKGQFKKVFKFGDILYSEIRPANKRFAYIDFDATDYIASTKLMVLRNNDKVTNRFLYHYLKSESTIAELQALAESRSGTFPQITFSELSQLEISIPDIETQLAISSFIDTLESKIELNRQINDNLEQQAQALYKSWFVDFEPFKDQEFVESEFGLIPEGWHCTTLSELLSIKYGKDHKKLAEGIIPVYGSGGLMRYVDTKLHEGEAVLIPRKGSLNNVMYVNEAFWTVDTMFYSIPKQEYFCIYAYLFLANKDLASMNAGSAVPSMTTDILNNMHIIAPHAEVLKRFNNICNVYFSRINQNNIENANLSKQRDTLLPKLMSGELKINKIDC